MKEDSHKASVIEYPAVAFHEKLSEAWSGLYVEKASFNTRARLLAEMVKYASMNLPSGDADVPWWLDAGCGTGNISRIMIEMGMRVTGIDASNGMLRAAEQACNGPRAAFQNVQTVESLPFDSSTFDGVMCSSVIEYLKFPRRCVSELARVTKSGGYVIVSVPNRNSAIRRTQHFMGSISSVLRAWPAFEYLKYSKNSYVDSEARNLISSVGLDLVRVEYLAPFMPWPVCRCSWGRSLIVLVARKW